MNNMELDKVIEFIYIVYLSTMFQRTWSFKKYNINLMETASKAMDAILNQERALYLYVSCQLD